MKGAVVQFPGSNCDQDALRAARMLGDAAYVWHKESELPPDASQLSYQIGARLPLPPEERQAVLSDTTTAERLARLNRLLRRELALLQRTRSIAVSPAVLISTMFVLAIAHGNHLTNMK